MLSAVSSFYDFEPFFNYFLISKYDLSCQKEDVNYNMFDCSSKIHLLAMAFDNEELASVKLLKSMRVFDSSDLFSTLIIARPLQSKPNFANFTFDDTSEISSFLTKDYSVCHFLLKEPSLETATLFFRYVFQYPNGILILLPSDWISFIRKNFNKIFSELSDLGFKWLL